MLTIIIMCLLSCAIFKYWTIEQFGKINLANYRLVLISQIITLASIYEVPITRILLSSDKQKVETSGDIAVNLCSSGLKNVYMTGLSASGSSLSYKKTSIEPALYMILSWQSNLTLFLLSNALLPITVSSSNSQAGFINSSWSIFWFVSATSNL